MILLPLFTDTGNYEYDIEIEGNNYTLRYFWSDRSSTWYLSISNAEGVIISGVPVFNGEIYLSAINNVDLPDGLWFLLANQGIIND